MPAAAEGTNAVAEESVGDSQTAGARPAGQRQCSAQTRHPSPLKPLRHTSNGPCIPSLCLGSARQGDASQRTTAMHFHGPVHGRGHATNKPSLCTS
jgi:hypothetical protein